MATNALAEAIVREATSSASGRGDTSYREFRSKASRGGEHFASPSRDDVFWRYVTGRAPILKSELGHERLATLSESEHRTLSKATGRTPNPRPQRDLNAGTAATPQVVARASDAAGSVRRARTGPLLVLRALELLERS